MGGEGSGTVSAHRVRPAPRRWKNSTGKILLQRRSESRSETGWSIPKYRRRLACLA